MYPPPSSLVSPIFRTRFSLIFIQSALKLGTLPVLRCFFFSYRVSATCNSYFVEGSMKPYSEFTFYHKDIFTTRRSKFIPTLFSLVQINT